MTVAWNAADDNGIAAQVLEVRSVGTGPWQKVADLSSASRSHTFAWGEREKHSFEARIVATDLAGNSGTGVAPAWSPQIFNAGVLTSSVQCFFCHIRVEGLIAGIDFPVSGMHANSGENLKATQGIYATGAIPPALKDPSITSPALLYENYTNTQLAIFPKKTDPGTGKLVFPTLSAADLAPQMDGSARNGDGARINRIYHGNLVLSSLPGKPMTKMSAQPSPLKSAV